jgi:excisionase family DNA binding protein
MPKNKSHVRLSAVNGNTRRRYVTIDEAAEYLSLHPATIRQMLADRRLTPYKLGPRVVRVDLNQIDDAMEQGGVA